MRALWSQPEGHSEKGRHHVEYVEPPRFLQGRRDRRDRRDRLFPGSCRVLGANDQVRLGFIGVGNRGCQLLKGFLAQPDARVVALCDVYQPYLKAQYDKVDPRFANLDGAFHAWPRFPATWRE